MIFFLPWMKLEDASPKCFLWHAFLADTFVRASAFRMVGVERGHDERIASLYISWIRGKGKRSLVQPGCEAGMGQRIVGGPRGFRQVVVSDGCRRSR